MSRIYPENIRSYVADTKHGLTESAIYHSLKVECTYYPYQFCAWDEAHKNGETYETVLKDIQAFQFFELRLSDSTGQTEFLKIDGDPLHYQQRLNYLLNDIQRDVLLIDGKDTMYSIDHHLERTFGVVPYNKVLFTFKNIPKQSFDKTLMVLDPIAGGQAMFFSIKSSSLKKIPGIRKK